MGVAEPTNVAVTGAGGVRVTALGADSTGSVALWQATVRVRHPIKISLFMFFHLMNLDQQYSCWSKSCGDGGN